MPLTSPISHKGYCHFIIEALLLLNLIIYKENACILPSDRTVFWPELEKNLKSNIQAGQQFFISL